MGKEFDIDSVLGQIKDDVAKNLDGWEFDSAMQEGVKRRIDMSEGVTLHVPQQEKRHTNRFFKAAAAISLVFFLSVSLVFGSPAAAFYAFMDLFFRPQSQFVQNPSGFSAGTWQTMDGTFHTGLIYWDKDSPRLVLAGQNNGLVFETWSYEDGSLMLMHTAAFSDRPRMLRKGDLTGDGADEIIALTGDTPETVSLYQAVERELASLKNQRAEYNQLQLTKTGDEEQAVLKQKLADLEHTISQREQQLQQLTDSDDKITYGVNIFIFSSPGPYWKEAAMGRITEIAVLQTDAGQTLAVAGSLSGGGGFVELLRYTDGRFISAAQITFPHAAVSVTGGNFRGRGTEAVVSLENGEMIGLTVSAETLAVAWSIEAVNPYTPFRLASLPGSNRDYLLRIADTFLEVLDCTSTAPIELYRFEEAQGGLRAIPELLRVGAGLRESVLISSNSEHVYQWLSVANDGIIAGSVTLPGHVITVGDLNGDGVDEIVLGTKDGNVIIGNIQF